MNRKTRSWLWLGAIALLALALAGHWYTWYAPRSHPGSPRAGEPTSRLLVGAGDLPLRIWIPFPHQNLAAVERTLGDLEGLSEISSYLLAEDLGSLPSFGPFRLPPARDLVVAGSSDGDRIVLAASVYPLVGWLARVAGRLAGNAWLAGGPVQLRGRILQVEWQAGTWMAAQGKVSHEAGQAVPELSPSHAFLSVQQAVGPVPRGLYRLDVEAAGWRIVSVDSERRRAVESRPAERLPSALALIAASTSSSSGPQPATRTLVMLSGAEGAGEQLTRSVVVHHGPGERWRLPAERLLTGLGFEVVQDSLHGWVVTAYDEEAMGEASEQLSFIRGLLDSVDEPPLQLGVWMDLSAARRALAGLAQALDALPLPASEQARMWTIAARTLAGLDSSGSMSLRITGSPPHLELWVDRQGPD